jgi:hypothetical protein
VSHGVNPKIFVFAIFCQNPPDLAYGNIQNKKMPNLYYEGVLDGKKSQNWRVGEMLIFAEIFSEFSIIFFVKIHFLNDRKNNHFLARQN